VLAPQQQLNLSFSDENSHTHTHQHLLLQFTQSFKRYFQGGLSSKPFPLRLINARMALLQSVILPPPDFLSSLRAWSAKRGASGSNLPLLPKCYALVVGRAKLDRIPTSLLSAHSLTNFATHRESPFLNRSQISLSEDQ